MRKYEQEKWLKEVNDYRYHGTVKAWFSKPWGRHKIISDNWGVGKWYIPWQLGDMSQVRKNAESQLIEVWIIECLLPINHVFSSKPKHPGLGLNSSKLRKMIKQHKFIVRQLKPNKKGLQTIAWVPKFCIFLCYLNGYSS